MQLQRAARRAAAGPGSAEVALSQPVMMTNSRQIEAGDLPLRYPSIF